MPIKHKIAELFTPREKLNSIYDLNLWYLQKRGIKGMVLDIENTLLTPSEADPSIKCKDWLESIKGYGFKVCLISNDRNEKRITYLADALKVPAVHTALRPLPWALENAMTEVMGLKPTEVAVVGDTLLTDVFPGNWLSAHTILVEPIAEHEDPMTEWASRKAGDALARVITRKK